MYSTKKCTQCHLMSYKECVCRFSRKTDNSYRWWCGSNNNSLHYRQRTYINSLLVAIICLVLKMLEIYKKKSIEPIKYKKNWNNNNTCNDTMFVSFKMKILRKLEPFLIACTHVYPHLFRLIAFHKISIKIIAIR